MAVKHHIDATRAPDQIMRRQCDSRLLTYMREHNHIVGPLCPGLVDSLLDQFCQSIPCQVVELFTLTVKAKVLSCESLWCQDTYESHAPVTILTDGISRKDSS